MAKINKELQWLKDKHKYLRIAVIAKEIGMKPRALQGFASDKPDSHNVPFKIPSKYHEALITLIKEIRKS